MGQGGISIKSIKISINIWRRNHKMQSYQQHKGIRLPPPAQIINIFDQSIYPYFYLFSFILIENEMKKTAFQSTPSSGT